MKNTIDTSIYYDIADDLKKYPDAWCYIVVGGRNTGKTYGALKYHLQQNLPTCFIKRTNKDVDLLCLGHRLGEKSGNYEVDLSPYKSINRDLGTKVMAYKIDDGLGAFYHDHDGEPAGKPIAYLMSLNAVHKYKGFDLSECYSIIFDEFIPQAYERVSTKEGEQLMELYKTVSRDRVERGKEELKLICLANAVNVFNYTFDVLEVTDLVAEMSIKHQHEIYIEDRGIFIRLLETHEKMLAAEKKTGIYKAMGGTAWGRMAFGNEFAYNDFSNIKRQSLKNMKPMIKLSYRGKDYYIYSGPQGYYMTTAKNKCPFEYNLDKEMDQRKFYVEHGIDLLSESIDGRMAFDTYSMYDLIINYKKRFKF